MIRDSKPRSRANTGDGDESGYRPLFGSVLDAPPPVAVLYQGHTPPMIRAQRKPMKPGGYLDSSADIAYQLQRLDAPLLTPIPNPKSAIASHWAFADTAAGINDAVARGAKILWTNTILYRGHYIEKAIIDGVAIVGQTSEAVDRFDDKGDTNKLLRANRCAVVRSVLLDVPEQESRLVLEPGKVSEILNSASFSFPIVVKPVRGRGSEGVQRVDDLDALVGALMNLATARTVLDGKSFPRFGSRFIIEEYLPGDEITIGVLPPGAYWIDGREQRFSSHWSLTPVRRVGHINGVAPYNGVAAVITNSAILEESEMNDPAVRMLRQQCELAAKLVGARSAIRVDCRMDACGQFQMFDLNMKPNMTGIGRPNRDDQDSLLAIGAKPLKWNYPELVWNLLHQAYVTRK